MEQFVYSKLPKKSFRIIILEAGQPSDVVKCRIETHEVTASPKYEALSYVWGDPARTSSLDLEGRKLAITPALDAGLQRLRLPNVPRVLWVDQLCINQNDLDERAEQVQIMKTIYSKAERVIVWLGEDTFDEAPGAKEVIKKIDAVWDEHLQLLRFPGDKELEQRGLPLQSDNGWKNLQGMLNRPYFNRIWIVQECRVASNLIIVWGTEEFTWNELYHCYYWIAINSASTGGPEGVSLNINSEILFSETNCHDPRFKDEFGWLGLLKATRMKKATDPRDKLFALLGLFDDGISNVTPDYRKPDSEVFAAFVTDLIPRMNSLVLLSYAQLLKNDQYPLWAPRWTWDLQGDMTYKPFEHYQFNASGEMSPCMDSTSKWDVLTLKGIYIDELIETTQPLAGGLIASESDDLFADNLIDEAWKVLAANRQRAEQHYPGTSELLKAFVWTLTAGQDLYQEILMYKLAGHSHLLDFAVYHTEKLMDIMEALEEKPSPEEWKRISSSLQLAIDACEAYEHLESKDQARLGPISKETQDWLKDWTSWANEDDGDGKKMCEMFEKVGTDPDAKLRFQTIMGLVTAWRKLVVSENGWLGLAAHGVQPGDRICVLFGGATPYIIRPTETPDEYLFMGECYIHGLMDAEAIKFWEEGKMASKWFHLR